MLASNGSFKKSYEGRDRFRYQIRKKVQGKNTVKRELSSSVLEKFNGYDRVRYLLEKKEKQHLAPLNIVYESRFDESTTIQCFFTDKIYLAFRSHIGVVEKKWS